MSGNLDERVWKETNSPLSKRELALMEFSTGLLMLRRDFIPGGKSGLRSKLVSGPGGEAILVFLQIVRKICKVGPIRGCVVIYRGVPCGLIQGR